MFGLFDFSKPKWPEIAVPPEFKYESRTVTEPVSKPKPKKDKVPMDLDSYIEQLENLRNTVGDEAKIQTLDGHTINTIMLIEVGEDFIIRIGHTDMAPPF